jgi:predicted nucleic acid-binding protein
MLDSWVGQSLAQELPANDKRVVPIIVQYELACRFTREMSDAAAASTIAFSTRLLVKPLDTELATKAADNALKHGLAMADSIIYPTAVDTGADLLTCALHFAELPNVVYFAKASR